MTPVETAADAFIGPAGPSWGRAAAGFVGSTILAVVVLMILAG